GPPPAPGDVEDAPPPLLARFGPEDVPSLMQAAGRLDGRLVRVLEPGAATLRERLLLDLAVLAFAAPALAWGHTGHGIINSLAVDILPDGKLKEFLKKQQTWIKTHAV